MTAKHACLRDILARREQWRDELKLVRRLHGDVLAAAGILSGATLEKEQQRVTNASVQQRYAQWCEELRERLTSTTLSETERRCLSHFLHVTTNMSPQLFNCYDLEAMPRTNNDMEGFIRSVKTRYRRVSGRKNWNRYLIRYGTRVAFYEARSRSGELAEMTAGMRRVNGYRWRQDRLAQTARQQEQLKQHRVRHQRDAYLADQEARWAALHPRT
ncbi:MAG: hypothetical protein IPP13_07960 [Kouleothrix sp.]|nr:hypothetical protein [Kouleothrix sp.]